jgi:hypothetical protein
MYQAQDLGCITTCSPSYMVLIKKLSLHPLFIADKSLKIPKPPKRVTS